MQSLESVSLKAIKLKDIKGKEGTEIAVTLARSVIGSTPKQRKTARALGLRKTGSIRHHKLNNSVYGMLKSLEHLIKVDLIK